MSTECHGSIGPFQNQSKRKLGDLVVVGDPDPSHELGLTIIYIGHSTGGHPDNLPQWRLEEVK